MRTSTLAFVLLALAGLAGCSRESSQYGRCETIFDCRTGQACADGYCAAGAPVPVGTFGVELIPASNVSGGPIRDELPGVALAGGDIALQFDQPAVLSGSVVFDTSAQVVNNTTLGATITITRPSVIGLSPTSYTVQAASGLAVGTTAFSVSLPRTQTVSDEHCGDAGSDCYQLQVVPTDLKLYPPLFKSIALPADRSLTVGVAEALGLMVTGVVKDAALLSGVQSVEVRVVDGDGRTVSSVKTTSSDADTAGSFQLVMASDAPVGTYWLQVAETQDNPNVPRSFYSFEVGQGGATASVDLGDVAMLDFQWPVSVSYRVRGPASNGKQDDVQGALVRFTTFLHGTFDPSTPSSCPTDKCAVYTRQATTDDKGEVQLQLIPPGGGGYEVAILPGPNSPYAAFHDGGLEVDQPGVGADFSLARKLEVRGTVVDAQGQPVAGATVTATPRAVPQPADVGGQGKMQSEDLALDEAPSTMQTDSSGQYLLMVEAGVTYDVVVAPASSSAAPITTVMGRTFQEAGRLDITLPDAALLGGTVSDWDGSAAAGALVRLYEQLTDIDTHETTVWLRGEAVARSDGTFKLLLPAGAAQVQ